MSEYDELIERLIKKNINDGMTEFQARMEAVMSDEALALVYPNNNNENKAEEI